MRKHFSQAVLQAHNEMEQYIENSSDPKFVPYSRSSREVKLLYSEHARSSLQHKSMNQKIMKVLRTHEQERKKARNALKQHSSKHTSPE